MAEKLTIYYEKSKLFRVICADGAIGGPTPTRDVFIALYNQRFALPKEAEQPILPDGTLGEQVVVNSKQGIFREMEIGLTMSAAVAEELARFLLQQVELLRKTDPKQEQVQQEK
jgi:hypothetical protein